LSLASPLGEKTRVYVGSVNIYKREMQSTKGLFLLLIGKSAADMPQQTAKYIVNSLVIYMIQKAVLETGRAIKSYIVGTSLGSSLRQ
jgi:type IV secretory pathway VirB6-like protein